LGCRRILKIFHLGQLRGIKTMAAMMTPDQTDAGAACKTLGVQVAALLPDWVVDRAGHARGLLFMGMIWNDLATMPEAVQSALRAES
jgi:hypothetical protein